MSNASQLLGVRISQLDPIPQDWTQEQLEYFLNNGIFPVSNPDATNTYKVVLKVLLQYISGNSIDSTSIAPEYNESESYKKDSFVVYNRELYIAKQDTEPGPFNSSYWKKVDVTEYIDILKNLISLNHSTEKTYHKNDYCFNNFKLYKCKVTATQGSFSLNEWDLVNNVCEELTTLMNKTKLSDFEDDISENQFKYNDEHPATGKALNSLLDAIVAEEYEQKTYSEGALCMHQGLLRKAKVDITVAEEFDNNKWDVVLIEDLIKDNQGTSTIIDSNITYNEVTELITSGVTPIFRRQLQGYSLLLPYISNYNNSYVFGTTSAINNEFYYYYSSISSNGWSHYKKLHVSKEQIANEYIAGNSYARNEAVWYDDKLYVALRDNEDSSFEPSHWSETNICDFINTKVSEAPIDDVSYARKNGIWITMSEALDDNLTYIELEDPEEP